MFVLPWKKKDNSREFKMPEGLSRKQQEEVKVIIKNARKDDGTPRSAQQTLPEKVTHSLAETLSSRLREKEL